MRQITISLPNECVEHLDKFVEQNPGVSRAELVRWLLPMGFWDVTTGYPVPPSAAHKYPHRSQSIRTLF